MDVIHAADAAELEHRLERLVGRRAGVADQSGDARCDRRPHGRRSRGVHDHGEQPVARRPDTQDIVDQGCQRVHAMEAGASDHRDEVRSVQRCEGDRMAVLDIGRAGVRLAIEIRIDVDHHGGVGP